MRRIEVNELEQLKGELRVGEKIELSGTVYTARDAAHKRINALIENNQPLPFPIKNAVIYYAGPTEAPPNAVIGSCGPTTSGRMDIFTSKLYDLGLSATIGKGERNASVIEALVRNSAVYFCALGGAGALASKRITSLEVFCFEDLGCESVKKLKFKNFPLIVAADSKGDDIFKQGREKYNP